MNETVENGNKPTLCTEEIVLEILKKISDILCDYLGLEIKDKEDLHRFIE